MNIPNTLTIARIFFVPLLVAVLVQERIILHWNGAVITNDVVALIIFWVAAATDLLDGYLARRWKQVTTIGTLLDPIADKLMLVTSFIVLSMRTVFPVPVPRHLPIPFWVTITVISRDAFILVGAGAINIVTGFRGFRPSWPGKVSTVAQIITIAAVMLAARVRIGAGYYLPTIYACVFGLTLFSGIHYVFFVSRLMNEERR